MKVLHVSFSDINGGAAKAAFRAHCALRSNGVDSRVLVGKAFSGDPFVIAPRTNFHKAIVLIRTQLGVLFSRLLKTSNTVLHSPQILPSRLVKKINSCDVDIVSLHWTQAEFLSISDIARIKKPVVWTLHDMWAFCGAEHYTCDYRWREGYTSLNRPAYESGFDINRWTWHRKKKLWKEPINIISPSNWLGKCVSESALMRDWPVKVIHNPINVYSWKPIPMGIAREILGLPNVDVSLIVFGAMGGGSDPRKGFGLLMNALKLIRAEPYSDLKIELVVFGEREPLIKPDMGFPIHYMGMVHDDFSLKVIYSAINLTVIPSIQDNLPNIAVESQACGAPVVSFNIGGLPDVVQHKRTGYLAEPFDEKDLADGILWVLNQPTCSLREQSRKNAIDNFSEEKYFEGFSKYAEMIVKQKSPPRR